MTRPAAAVVEAEVVGSTVEAVLRKVRAEGVPVRSQPMEYARELCRSSLPTCGLQPPGGGRMVDVLVRELRARGATEDRAEVGAAALCLMLGGLDEAHNLVTPHSWATPTTFGGPPKYGSPSRQDAAYCHIIVHRMEGNNPGEFGTGFNNSGFWIGNALGATGTHAIFPRLREAATDLAAGCREAEAALRAMGPQWKPRKFNSLCEEGLECNDKELLAFCGAVQTKELLLFFEHVVGF